MKQLCSKMPPINEKGRQFLEMLEALPGDKLVTIHAYYPNSVFSQLYHFDVGRHAPKTIKALALRLFSQCCSPGRAGSVIVCQFQGRRGDGCPRNIYGFFISPGDESLPSIKRISSEEVEDACCRDFGGVPEVGATYC